MSVQVLSCLLLPNIHTSGVMQASGPRAGSSGLLCMVWTWKVSLVWLGREFISSVLLSHTTSCSQAQGLQWPWLSLKSSQAERLSAAFPPRQVWRSWHFVRQRWHPHTVLARSSKPFLQLQCRRCPSSFLLMIGHPFLHHSLLLQASSLPSRHMAAILQAHAVLLTMLLISGDLVVSFPFPSAACRAMCLFPACTICVPCLGAIPVQDPQAFLPGASFLTVLRGLLWLQDLANTCLL